MLQLHQNSLIYIGKDSYRLLQEPKENHREHANFTTWNVPVKKEATEEIYFLKYTEEEDEAAVRLLKREGQFKMYYPFIEHVYDSFSGKDEAGNCLYGVLAEYIDGLDLRSYRKGKHLVGEGEKEMFRGMMQLLRGVRYYLEFLKDDPFVHRDLKPENIMISRDGKRIVISDFDWAHIPKSEGTRFVSSIGGTLGYADPRAWTSNVTDVKMDIYSLGRILFFWVKGHDYFSDAESKIYFEKEHRELAYGSCIDRFPVKYQEEQYRPFREILAKMVAAPEKRYESITEILKDMISFLISYYGEEVYERTFQESSLLLMPENRSYDEKVRFGYSCSSDHIRVHTDVKNFSMRDYIIKNVIVMTLYCLDGRLYYIPIHPDLRKEKEDGSYEIKDDDVFYFGKETIDFVVW